MGKSFILSSLVGALIAFCWGFISWVVIPWHMNNIHRFQDAKKVSEVFMDNAPENGVYVLHPMECATSNPDQRENCAFVFASVKKMHMNDNQYVHILYSFFNQLIAAVFITWLLMNAKAQKYWDRVTFVTIVGLVGGVLTLLPAWNWWGFSVSYTAVGMIDLVISWFLAGLAMAKLTKLRRK